MCKDLNTTLLLDVVRPVSGKPVVFIWTSQTCPLKPALGGPLLEADGKLAWIWIVAIEFKNISSGIIRVAIEKI